MGTFIIIVLLIIILIVILKNRPQHQQRKNEQERDETIEDINNTLLEIPSEEPARGNYYRDKFAKDTQSSYWDAWSEGRMKYNLKFSHRAILFDKHPFRKGDNVLVITVYNDIHFTIEDAKRVVDEFMAIGQHQIALGQLKFDAVFCAGENKPDINYVIGI